MKQPASPQEALAPGGGEPAHDSHEKSLHVAFGLLTLFPERVGGTETYVRNLLDEYGRRHGPQRVTVLANRHVERAYRSRVRGPVDLYRVRSYRAGDSSATRALAMAAGAVLPRLVARDVPSGFDVLHHPVTVPIPRLDVPTVVTIHEIQQHDRPGALGRPQRLYRRWAYDGSARDATLVIAITHYLRDQLIHHLGVDPDRIEVIHLGVDLERFSPDAADDEAVLEKLGLHGRYVVYPANFWPHKNHERLLEAFAKVDEPELRLVLAGQHYGRLDAVMRQASRLGLGGRVSHLGYLKPEQLAAVYRSAEAMLFPSLYEGFGAPPLEAMACGCPVASSMAASLAEVCGDAALPLDQEDPAAMATAIGRVVGDRDLRARLREAGLTRARKFSWRAAAVRHREVYARAAEM